MWRNQMTGRPHQQLERVTARGERHDTFASPCIRWMCCASIGTALPGSGDGASTIRCKWLPDPMFMLLP